MRSNNLKEQDVLLAVYLLGEKRFRRQVEYTAELGISQAEISGSLKRLIKARLIDSDLHLPYRRNLREFLVHGLKYAFAVKPGPIAKGVPTASSAPPLSGRLRSSGLPMVWASEHSAVEGQSIEPLYPTVPAAVQENQSLYEVLALIDSLRVGKPREQAIAVEELEERLQ